MLKKRKRSILPGGLPTTQATLGMTKVLKMAFNMMWSYRRTMRYLIRTKGIKALSNFLFVKLFVPTGEGATAGAYPIIGPLLRRFPALAPYPYNIEIEITNKCNKRCVICEHTYWNEPSVDLSFENFKKIVDQFPKLKWVNLTGEGDAFMNKDYLKMIRYLKAKKIPVFLVDSFDLINEGIAKELVDIGVDGIYISFDAATKETYEKIKVGCNFDRSLKNIKNLIKIKKEIGTPIPELCFRFIVTTLNKEEMPQFVDLVSSLGDRGSLGDGSRIEFTGLLYFKENKHLYVPKIPKEILKETVDHMKKTNMHVLFSHSEPEKWPPLEHCLNWMEPYIMMGGYVLPCCSVLMSNRRDWLRKHSLGNILNEPFKDIWNSPRYTRFRQTINKQDAPVPLLCRGCRAYTSVEREHKYGVAMDL